jgi:hypothetical protein
VPLLDAITKKGAGNLSGNKSAAWKDHLAFSIALAVSFFNQFVYVCAFSSKMRASTDYAGFITRR